MTVWLPTAPLTAAERKRRQRRRQECGRIVVPVEVDEIRVTEALRTRPRTAVLRVFPTCS
jgi:hypothetical protein